MLESFNKQMTALQGRVLKLEGKVEALQKELDAAQSALFAAERERDAFASDRNRYAEINVLQAARIVTLEADVARAQVHVEALQTQLAMVGRHVATERAGESLQSGDAVILTKDDLGG